MGGIARAGVATRNPERLSWLQRDRVRLQAVVQDPVGSADVGVDAVREKDRRSTIVAQLGSAETILHVDACERAVAFGLLAAATTTAAATGLLILGVILHGSIGGLTRGPVCCTADECEKKHRTKEKALHAS